MEIRQIQYFLKVARSLNFTVAANELQISQATLSRQIAAMEAELNLLLFFRDNRNVKLTQSGEYLYQEFSKLYGSYQTITDNAKKIFEGYSGELSFGILEEISLRGKLQEIIHAYSKTHPNHTLNFKRYSFKGITDGLLTGELDFGVTLFFDISNITSLKYKIIQKAPAGIVISARHPLSKKDIFRPKEFKNETFIILSGDDSRYASSGAIEYCLRYGFYPKIRFAPDLDTAMLWVEAGIGVAFTNKDAISVLNPAMTFIPFAPEDDMPEFILVLAWNPSNINPAMEIFLKEFQERKQKND